MRNNIFLKIIAILFCFFVVLDVEASTCTTKELNELKQLAHNVKFSYELSDDTYNDEHVYYFNIYLTNLNEKIYVEAYNGLTQSYHEGKENIFYLYREGNVYPFDIYASSKTNCKDKLLSTKKIELPYYNDYSQKEECIEYSEFKLCDPYYDGYIENDEYFYKQLEKYKESLKEEPKVIEKQNIFQTLMKIYVENLVIAVPCTLVVIGLIAFGIVKFVKNKKKVKIKI